MKHHGRVVLLALLPLVLLTACGDKKGSHAETQVAAKVNGDEISVHQINFAISRLGPVQKGKEVEGGKQVLKELVDQQVLVQQAIEKKLDRNPNVLQAIEAAKRQILAQAFLEEVLQKLVKPTDAEIHDYYVKEPDLFASRRIYRFSEITIPGGTAQIDKIKQLLTGAKTLEQFAERLRTENITFKAVTAVKAAEELPMALLPKFSKMTDGEVAIIPTRDSLNVLQLQDSKNQPLTEQQAKPVIENFLLGQKRNALLEVEMKKLRDAAKIEYLGAYADTGKAGQSPAAAQSTAPQPAVGVTVAAPEVKPGEPAPAKDNHVEKGLSGL
jgi:EpsD family peptidyl-prolyl cis-trans isomerase